MHIPVPEQRTPEAESRASGGLVGWWADVSPPHSSDREAKAYLDGADAGVDGETMVAAGAWIVGLR